MKNKIYLLIFLSLTAMVFHAQEPVPVQEVAYFENSITYSTKNSSEHTTLSEAVTAADLDDILGSDGPFTVFAPSDQAFKKLSPEKVEELLLPHNKSKLQSLITYHMIAGHLSASKILKAMCRGAGTATFTTVQGNKLTATMEGIDIVLTDSFGNKAKITTADANQCNGVIHVIDSVILPKKI